MQLSRMPEIHRAITINMPRGAFFPLMLDYLAQNGCTFAAVDLIFQRVRCQLTRPSSPFQPRFVIWIYGKGEQTGLVFGVERPLWSRFLGDKHKFGDALQEMETLLTEAVGHKLLSAPEKTLAMTAVGARTGFRRKETVAASTAAMA